MSLRSRTLCVVAAVIGLMAAEWVLRAPAAMSASNPLPVSSSKSRPEKTSIRPVVVRHQAPVESVASDLVISDEALVDSWLSVLDQEGNGQGLVWVDVMTEDGRPVVDASLTIENCLWVDPAEEDTSNGPFFPITGEPFLSPMSPGSCEFRAIRYDGLLPIESPSQRVEVTEGGLAYVSLILPQETGGIGIQLGMADDGIRVVGIFADSPAWESGLEVGDVIISVGGIRASEMSLKEFAAVCTGPIGEMVHLSIRREDQDGSVFYMAFGLSREYLSEDLPLADGLHYWD